MKVFGGQFFFLLPDDFNGGLNEAIEEWLKFRKEKGGKPKTVAYPKEINELLVKSNNAVFQNFLKNLEDDGKRFTGALLLSEQNKEGEFEPMNWCERVDNG